MKGDFSRITFKKEKQYSKVNMQQGRIQVDADWNEQIDILNNFGRTSLRDVIGQSGAPAGNPGYSIEPHDFPEGPSYFIGEGRFYVDGILVENQLGVEASRQPQLPLNKDGTSLALAYESGLYLAYLDVWERHITELDDPEIKESALNGPDTTTRSKIIWQVKLYPLHSESAGVSVLPRGDRGILCQTPAFCLGDLYRITYGNIRSSNKVRGARDRSAYRYHLEQDIEDLKINSTGSKYIARGKPTRVLHSSGNEIME